MRSGFDFSAVSCDGTAMPTEVKICGLSEEESVDAALQAGADFVGFVFFPPSPRNVAIDRAATLAKRARGKAGIVALTVDADDSLFTAIAETLRPDLLQLHGSETPERVAAVCGATGRAVMKVLSVGTRDDLAAAERYPSAERFLIDAKPPKDATRPGGNAVAFDWSILEGFRPPKPWLLAGGLNPENVAAALRLTGAPGVDVSSGVETAPGRKDVALIHAFLRAAREHDASVRPLQRVAI
jgi:phosphoribosylanthranilate isomerase